MTKQENQQQVQQTAVAKFENISDVVLERITSLQAEGALKLPENYAVENHLKSAWLLLQDSDKKVLTTCTKSSICNALMKMVMEGLSLTKNQCYFIPYGDKLQYQRSYFGTVALAKRAGNLKGEPVANIVYEGDDFQYNIDPETGEFKIIKHDQKMENIDSSKIKGAYCILFKNDGSKVITIMNIAQIRASWNQGATKGNSSAHKNFADEMAKKTVINRACKMIINSSNDAWLYEDVKDEESDAEIQRQATTDQPKTVVVEESVSYEEVTQEETEDNPY